MPRNMSFSITTHQFRSRIKTVTRRVNWRMLKRGDIVMGCEQCMGLKPGEKIVRLGKIRITDVRREQLRRMCDEPYGSEEAAREGFPGMSGLSFVRMFRSHMGVLSSTVVTRIEYEYVDVVHTAG